MPAGRGWRFCKRSRQSWARPGRLDREGTQQLERRLTFWGYTRPASRPVRIGLRAYQEAYGLRVTGNLTRETCRHLNAYRCARSDAVRPIEGDMARLRISDFKPRVLSIGAGLTVEPEINVDTTLGPDHQYDAVNARWSHHSIRYALAAGIPVGVGEDAWPAVQQAFATWARDGSVTLSASDQKNAEVRVLWTPGPAGDPNSTDPFYGPDGYVAYGYYPYPQLGELAGDLHFNSNDSWSTDGHGLDVETVALHEIGHCLGIGHSRNQDSTMWPQYKSLQRDVTAADRQELARIYQGVPA